MNARATVLFASAALLTGGPAIAQDKATRLQILPGSEFTFATGFAPIPDCDGNDDLQCDFLIEGAFTLHENLTNGSAAIVDASITLISPLTFDPEPFPGQLVTGDRVAGFLEAQVYLAIPSIPESVAYQALLAPGAADPLIVSYELLNGDGGSLTGGFDYRPVDGNAAFFNTWLRIVPEPASSVLVALAVVSLGSRSVRG